MLCDQPAAVCLRLSGVTVSALRSASVGRLSSSVRGQSLLCDQPLLARLSGVTVCALRSACSRLSTFWPVSQSVLCDQPAVVCLRLSGVTVCALRSASGWLVCPLSRYQSTLRSASCMPPNWLPTLAITAASQASECVEIFTPCEWDLAFPACLVIIIGEASGVCVRVSQGCKTWIFGNVDR